ncbi:MAG TPA: efflux RND transporter periplasmic adaptor subunit [Gemmatimonadales bacterium]|jgi:multidrug efflux system membrane fusion protein
MTHSVIVRALVGLTLLPLIGCGRKGAPPNPPVPVTLGTAERRAVPFELTATGTVEPLQTVAVLPQVSGLLMRIAFTEGQEVQKGQTLFEIDPRPFRAALDQALANLARDSATAANAEQDAKRYSALADKEYVTAQQYDQAKTTASAAQATLAASRAAVEQARLNLQYATIRAPIAGRTGSLRVRQGNLVRTSDTTPLVTINQIRPILTRFAVPASNLGSIQQYRSDDPPVRAQPAGGGEVSEGKLSFVDNAVDTTTGTILLKGLFPNQDGALWPGEFVDVHLRLYVDQNALVVPASAVVSGQQGTFVFVVGADSTAATKKVKVSRTATDLAVVSGEIQPGDRVVTDGQLRLRAGSKVQIKSMGDSARAGVGAS